MITDTDRSAASHVMSRKSNKDFFGRWIQTLLLVVVCLLPIGFSSYVCSGKSVSVGQFEVRHRDDGLWSYKNGKAVSFSASGATLQTGQTYCIGPFRITHWTRDWKIK
jgi:hypothetical protein